MAATHPARTTKTVGVRELRQNLSRYLERVKDGETLTVTERGHEVARLVPSGPEINPDYLRLAEKFGATIPKGDLVETSRKLRALRSGHPGAPAGTGDALLAEGRGWRF
ncbi:MAG TPA: type II toxin-antitoxin system prevent-host-death family antitoxin [Solirubrobacteraceae bacterium]